MGRITGNPKESNLPLDEIGLNKLTDEVMSNPPVQGYVTISNALQWRLQYNHAINIAGREQGVLDVYRADE